MATQTTDPNTLMLWLWAQRERELDTKAQPPDHYWSEQTLTPKDTTSTRWQHSYQYFGLLFVQWEEVEMHQPSLYI